MAKGLSEPGWHTRGWVLALGLAYVVGLSASPLPPLGEALLTSYGPLSLDETFSAVATGIRYEPYAGVLRGPRSTALAKGGNAADQALLLAELLGRKGYRVRFVQGRMQGENLRTLLRGLYQPELPVIETPDQFGPFDPFSDKLLAESAAAHIWLELEQPGADWLPLDPAFPRARVGQAYAEATQRFEQLPAEHYHRLRISAHERLVNGATRELGSVEGRVMDLALQPLSFAVLGTPQLQSGQEKPKKGVGDMFGGALSGDAPKPQETGKPVSDRLPPAGTLYRRTLLAAGQRQAVASTLVLDAEPEGSISREWLRFELLWPDGKQRVIERDTFLRSGAGDVSSLPAAYRRYSIAVSAGPLDPAVAAQHAQALGRQADLPAMRRQQEAAARDPKQLDASSLAALEETAGTLAGHLASLSLSAELSELTRRIAFGNGVSYAQVIPSLTIVSVEGDSADRLELAADLRLDEVEAWPYPGAASRVAEHFQGARGIQGTMLEGFFVEKLAGRNTGATALSLLTANGQGPGGWLVFAPGDEAELAQIEGLLPSVRQQLEATLASGREVIINARPVALSGRERHGWWERDLTTGRIVGVMDDGRHGAMVEYTLKTESLGLSDDSFLVLGLLVGATGTQTLIAAKVLEEGTLTQEAIKEIEKMLETLQCLSCPKAEAKAEAEFKTAISCFEVDNKTKFGDGKGALELKLQFCENYVKGLKCASGIILGGYKSKPTIGRMTYEAKAEVKIGCEELFKKEKKFSDGRR